MRLILRILTHSRQNLSTYKYTNSTILSTLQEPKFRFPTPNTPNTMNRTHLLQAFSRTATADGYHFHSTDDRYIPQLVTAYPALWLSPPEFKQIKGRKHGTITYNITAHALDAGAKLSPTERTARHTALEEELIKVFSSLSEEEFVVAVENLSIRHSSQTLTSAGEVAATATAEVITFF